ncbi:MAG TPA: SGNH/GDSL hydrolase family protein [Bryobacteraceae bacterium]|jgi:phospholipase/lecithinase/hemolysin|nr:SGNH/GDSL hydrolase family protein [Bryobacteraceae bacterium]
MFLSTRRIKRFAVIASLLFFPLYAASASSVNQLVVFGDSLSDNGNAYLASAGAFPGANYGLYTFAGTALTTSFYTDGPNTTPKAAGPQGLWVDQLAAKLNVPDPLPYLAGGTNYAVASALTGTANLQDVGNQVAAYSVTHPAGASPTALYSFWAGANDILNGGSPITAANNIESYIDALSLQGGKNFVWLNLPLLGDTPEGSVDKTALNAASIAFNTQWADDLAVLQGQGVHVTGVNIGALFSGIVGNPGLYGFTNVTSPAQTSGAATDAGYLFWDDIHPTTAAHALIADAVDSSLTATPEPSTVTLAFLGFAALAGLSMKRRRA